MISDYAKRRPGLPEATRELPTALF